MPLLAASMLCSATLAGEPADLPKQIQEISELLKPAEGDSEEVAAAKLQFRSLPGSLLAALQHGRPEHLSRALDGSQPYFVVPGLTEKLEEFRKAAQDEAERKEEAAVAEMDALLAEVDRVLMSAKKTEDLDELQLKLSQVRGDYNENPRTSLKTRDIQTALQIVGKWQDYLISRETGDHKGAQSHLQQVANQLSATPILPRSHVLRLLHKAPDGAAEDQGEGPAEHPKVLWERIAADLVETGDTQAALEKVSGNPHLQGNDSEITSQLRSLQSIDRLRRLEPAMSESEVMAGARMEHQHAQSQNRLIFSRAIDQIILNSIARSFAIETPSATVASSHGVLDSIARAALGQQNWPKLRQALFSMANLQAGGYGPDNERRTRDLHIIGLLELAKEAEERRDLAAAVNAYVDAARTDGFYIQRQIPYSKLTDLKEKFPEEVVPLIGKSQEVSKLFEVARAAAETEARMNAHRSMPFGPGMGRHPDFRSMRPMVEEVVAQFLRERRTEEVADAEAEEKAPVKEPGKEQEKTPAAE